jgi:hypothetical protein
MRGLLAGLLVALVISAVALLVATIGALGVAAIGLLLHHWFDLTQWQGTIIALIVAISLGYLVYRLASQVPAAEPWDRGWENWEDEEDEEEAPEIEEPPIVPWRRSRPTPGELPEQKPAGKTGKPAGKGK